MLQLQYFNKKLTRSQFDRIFNNYCLKYKTKKLEIESKLNIMFEEYIKDILEFLENMQELGQNRKKIKEYEMLKNEVKYLNTQLKEKKSTEERLYKRIDALNQENLSLKNEVNTYISKFNDASKSFYWKNMQEYSRIVSTNNENKREKSVKSSSRFRSVKRAKEEKSSEKNGDKMKNEGKNDDDFRNESINVDIVEHGEGDIESGVNDDGGKKVSESFDGSLNVFKTKYSLSLQSTTKKLNLSYDSQTMPKIQAKINKKLQTISPQNSLFSLNTKRTFKDIKLLKISSTPLTKFITNKPSRGKLFSLGKNLPKSTVSSANDRAKYGNYKKGGFLI